MRPRDIREEVEKILFANIGKYLTAYQIFELLKAKTRRKIIVKHGRRSGKNTGAHYSGTLFVAQAAKMIDPSPIAIVSKYLYFNFPSQNMIITAGYPTAGAYTYKCKNK